MIPTQPIGSHESLCFLCTWPVDENEEPHGGWWGSPIVNLGHLLPHPFPRQLLLDHDLEVLELPGADVPNPHILRVSFGTFSNHFHIFF